MDRKTENRKKKKVNYIVECVYVGETPMNEVFKDVIEHVVDTKIRNENEMKEHA